MTLTNTTTMIYIGNFAPIDNDESDWDTDNATSLNGTYNAFEDLELVDITNHDVDEDGAIMDDEAGSGDFAEYTRDGNAVTSGPDATVTYFATVTEQDGTVHNIDVVVIQMTNGDVFVTDLLNSGTLDNLTIRSIELTAPNNTNSAGYYSDQHVENTTVCFAAGTLIDCAEGALRVETLRVGDLVATLDAGLQPIRLITSQRLNPAGHNAAISISPGALGPNQPQTQLRVSPQHRILVRSQIAKRMFDTDQVLIAAKRLLELPGVFQDSPKSSVRYWHILLAHHHIVKANGAWAETLLPAAQAQQALQNLTSFGDRSAFTAHSAVPARRLLEPKQQKRLVMRHAKNHKPLMQSDLTP